MVVNEEINVVEVYQRRVWFVAHHNYCSFEIAPPSINWCRFSNCSIHGLRRDSKPEGRATDSRKDTEH